MQDTRKPFTTSLWMLYNIHDDNIQNSAVVDTSKNFLPVIIACVETNAGIKRDIFLEVNTTEIQE